MSQDTNQRGKKRSKRWTLRLDGHTGDQTAATCLIDQTQICDTQVDYDKHKVVAKST